MSNCFSVVYRSLCVAFVLVACIANNLPSRGAELLKKRVLLVAGKPSHPPRMHEFNAGVQLIAKCLKNSSAVDVQYVLNGWPTDPKAFDGIDAVVFYMDGGGRHEVVLDEGKRLSFVDELVKKGVGVGCMHYGVEIVPDQAGVQFKKWIGGHYEHMFSCNPIWEPTFSQFPVHPTTQGVKPFQIKDEWYFNMRFLSDIAGNEAKVVEGTQFVPILVAKPSDDVRDGPYVYPQGPYPHIVSNHGRSEAMLWTVERQDGGRGFGFTGGHFHDNWGDENFRKIVLNSILWIAHADVPANGVESSVSKEDLDANLDPKK